MGPWIAVSQAVMRSALVRVAERAISATEGGERMQHSSQTVPRLGSFMSAGTENWCAQQGRQGG